MQGRAGAMTGPQASHPAGGRAMLRLHQTLPTFRPAPLLLHGVWQE
jgi:hypothetical protein